MSKIYRILNIGDRVEYWPHSLDIRPTWAAKEWEGMTVRTYILASGGRIVGYYCQGPGMKHCVAFDRNQVRLVGNRFAPRHTSIEFAVYV